ncbi:ALQxL family class IV lanthipeptide [Pseudomonas caspiana]|uniref:ALQxL family class IV lanthipeptide n=1 Tax=Pseudomonas caspiana TaxID=1451454 RepID=UPI0032ECBA23
MSFCLSLIHLALTATSITINVEALQALPAPEPTRWRTLLISFCTPPEGARKASVSGELQSKCQAKAKVR